MTPGSAEDRLVLGLWGLGGAFASAGGPASYSHTPEAAFREVCDVAYSAGVRWVDVAPGYGGGEALHRLARWSVGHGQSFEVALKLGRPYVAGRPVSRLDPAELATELDSASAALGTRPEILMIKDPSADIVGAPDLHYRLEAAEARLGSPVGVATHHTEMTPSPGRNRVLQIEFNGVQWRRVRGLAEAARRQGWQVWGMQPLAYGFLADRSTSANFAEDDFRRHLPASVRAGLTGLAAVFHEPFRDLIDWTSAERALAFCLASPLLDRVVVGPKSVAQFRSVLRALELARCLAFQGRVSAQLAEGGVAAR